MNEWMNEWMNECVINFRRSNEIGNTYDGLHAETKSRKIGQVRIFVQDYRGYTLFLDIPEFL